MANRTNIGLMLGQALAGGLGGESRQRGYNDGITAQEKLSSIGKNNAETDLKKQQLGYGTDDSIMSSILSKFGANSPDGMSDFKASMAGNYKPLVGAPTEQQAQAGNTALPQPSYVKSFPDAASEYSALKQMLALGDKDFTHIGKAAAQDNLNNITRNVNPANALDVGTSVAAINGKVDDILKTQLANRIANDGKPNGNERGSLYLQGKSEFNNMGSDGTFNTVTGDNRINAIGQSVIDKNNAKEIAKDNTAPVAIIDPVTGQPIYVNRADAIGKTPLTSTTKLKPIPASINTAMVTNNQALSKLDAAIALLEGKDIGTGDSKMLGDKDATGLKGLVPPIALNRLDPKGVDARAAVADIGSLILHDRSGAAVTASESPRLVPFIPLSTDDNTTVLKKLRRLKEYQVTENDLLSNAYNEDAGYKVPIQTPAKSTAAPAKTTTTNDDAVAIAWAKSNPKDPRAAKILKLHEKK